MSVVLKTAVFALVFAGWPAAARATDSDGDGVDDSIDVCPNTPPGVAVDTEGRPLADLDGDCDGDLMDYAIFQSGFTGPLGRPEVCNDGADNDLDGLTDCADVGDCPAGTACGAHAACGPSATCDCSPGWGDCNSSMEADGCEAEFLNDPYNCGACGVACGAVPNAVATDCVNGQCVITACAAWYADCDMSYANGCETGLFDDPYNCGACGVPCGAVPNALDTTCIAGLCVVTDCADGYQDCDGVYANGCEANILSDPQHCGGCTACGMPVHVLSRGCSSGQCVITACTTGYADCNAVFSDGCEVNLMASTSCPSATQLPSMFGDEECEQFSSTNSRGSAWYRVWVYEGNTSLLFQYPLYFDATLQSPSGTDYDLYLWNACNGTVLDSSTLTGTQLDQVEYSWADNLTGDDSRQLWIEIRYYSGSGCGQWTLVTYGGCDP